LLIASTGSSLSAALAGNIPGKISGPGHGLFVMKYLVDDLVARQTARDYGRPRAGIAFWTN